jgi:tyrosinase
MPRHFVRQDIWTLEQQQTFHPVTLAYALAVRELQRRPAADPSSWVYQAAIHDTNVNPDKFRRQCQHNSWFFLAWHRMYLYWFERIVRSALQSLPEVDGETKQVWALPYWNYDRGGTTNSLPPAFRQPQLPNGDANPLFVPERNQQPGLDMNAGDGLPAQATSARLAFREQVFSPPPAAGVAGGFGGPRTGWHHFGENGIRTPGALELTPHGDVHVLVGGLGFMSSFDTAPLDPIFWLHHANIDRLWIVWLTHFGGSNPSDAAWLDHQFDFHDPEGNEVKNTPRQALDPLDGDLVGDFGYEYADVSPPAAILEARPMAPAPPPDHPAELVGASDEPVRLTGRLATVRFGVSRPAGPLAATPEATPSRVYLNVEDVQGERNPGVVYAVYANVPDDDDDPTNDAHYVGNISFFGIELTQDLDRDHPGGLRYAFDITDLYNRLREQGRWNEEEVKVTFAPLLPPGGAGPAAAEPRAEETPPVSVGRVSLFYQ